MEETESKELQADGSNSECISDPEVKKSYLDKFYTKYVSHEESAFSRNLIDAPIELVMHLTIKPGDNFFMFWFFIATYFPVITACMGPLANSFSLVASIEHWRVRLSDDKQVTDANYMYIMNFVSLGFGIFGNIFLLMNFSKKLHYLIAQFVSILCWVIASVLMLISILLSNSNFTGKHPLYRRTEGFWHGVYVTIFYAMCSILLMINLLGFFLGKYPAAFNLNRKQRYLMVYTILLGIWLIIGTVIVSHIFSGVNYGVALYFCVVTIMTVGLGDILPRTTGSKIFILVYAFIGILLILLIVTEIRQVVLATSKPTTVWHMSEKGRMKKLHKLSSRSVSLSSEQAFSEMKKIKKKARIRQDRYFFLFTILVFFVWLFLGSSIFFACEGWSYFDAFYFCLLCLFTIGYGDFHPKTAAGRAFFVVWGCFAVPLMTILISDLSDILTGKLFFNFMKSIQGKFEDLSIKLSHVFGDDTEDSNSESEMSSFTSLKKSSFSPDTLADMLHHKVDFYDKYISSLFEKELDDLDDEATITFTKSDLIRFKAKILHRSMERQKSIQNLLKVLAELKPLMSEILFNPEKKFTHDEWVSFFREVGAFSDAKKIDSIYKENFWIGEASPLRLPLSEPMYFFVRLLLKMEKDLNSLIQNDFETMETVIETRNGTLKESSLHDTLDLSQNNPS